jgi:site-specific recombinase XerD
MTEQIPLFQRKSFPATLTQGVPIAGPKPEMTILATLPAYFNYLQAQGLSKYTPVNFCGDLKKFGLFVPQKTLKDITVHAIRDWLSQLRTKEHMTKKTISRKVSALNNYFTWLILEQVLSENPAIGVANYKVTSPLPDILFDAECTRLLEASSQDPRTYLLVLLLLETGIKTEELLELELSHTDTSNAYAPEVWIKHSGKKVKKDRKLKLPREVVTVLSEYVAKYTIRDKVFPYSQRFIWSLLKAAGEAAQVKKPISSRLLRVTCAVRMLKSGESMETVLKKLGLSDTTWEDAKEKYLKLTSRAL